MPVLKPARAIRLNRSCACGGLIRGLVGCWLCNEGTGSTVFDASGNQRRGSFQGNAGWTDGKFGSAVDYDGSSAYVHITNPGAVLDGKHLSIVAWIYPESYPSYYPRIIDRVYNGQFAFYILDREAYHDRLCWGLATSGGSVEYGIASPVTITLNTWQQVALTYDGSNAKLYVNGIQRDSYGTGISGGLSPSSSDIHIGQRAEAGSDRFFDGMIDHVILWNRALSAAEIARLYGEPFCMFERHSIAEFLFMPIIDLAGASNAQSASTATVKLTKRISGSSDAVSATSAILKIKGEVLLAGSIDASAVPSGKLTLRYRGPWLKSPLKIERQWLTDALFNGMTSNAFKLSTVTTCGWFWMRPSGCTALYGGPSMEQIDFANILEVVEQDADSVTLPNYIPHKIDSTYFYVVRKFNICGYPEHTLQAAVKLAIDAEGNLTEPQPNHIFAWRADRIHSNKVQLDWFYCPLEQKSKLVRFKIYYDSGTGQIDFENSVATVDYLGRQFYRWQSNALTTGKYLFAIRAEDADGVECNSLAQLAIEIEGIDPDEIEVLKVETM